MASAVAATVSAGEKVVLRSRFAEEDGRSSVSTRTGRGAKPPVTAFRAWLAMYLRSGVMADAPFPVPIPENPVLPGSIPGSATSVAGFTPSYRQRMGVSGPAQGALPGNPQPNRIVAALPTALMTPPDRVASLMM